MALPPQHAPARMAQQRPPRRHNAPARPSARAPLRSAWARSGSIPILNRTLNKLANFSNHPDWTLRVCDNFDWYAPRYQSHHSLDELKRWFADEGFTDIVELAPAKNGKLYNWAYDHNLIIGSGVNVAGRSSRQWQRTAWECGEAHHSAVASRWAAPILWIVRHAYPTAAATADSPSSSS